MAIEKGQRRGLTTCRVGQPVDYGPLRDIQLALDGLLKQGIVAMACDYEKIRSENKEYYGTRIGQIGNMLLADRYDERTHFIFELLQNAEDALARREEWQGSRTVAFDLTCTSLRVSHFGAPFNEADVRGICGIAESTKRINEIGRFGIGFKSVYAFTEQPEIHSGSEDFAIEQFVWPKAVPIIDRDPEETIIQIPFRPADDFAQAEVANGLSQLGIYGLLFLTHIDEITWNVEGGAQGQYLRESTDIDSGVRRVTIIGQQGRESEMDEEWFVFSRPVYADEGRQVRPIEVAFSLFKDPKTQSRRIRRVDHSPLVVFFPTAIETHLGFLVQGPYITTPSRDNIPRNNEWNRHLVDETSVLLPETLRWLRDHDYLDTEALRCLPLEATKFASNNRFSPLFEATKEALLSEPLLPTYDSGYVPASHARLGRAQELRNLFSPSQLKELYEEENELIWLSSDITLDRARDLYDYLRDELDVDEITPDGIIRRLNRAFLEVQPDSWILELYEFLGDRPGLRRLLSGIPLIRLENRKQVLPQADGKRKAYLPTQSKTDFPTVRGSVCATKPALAFLHSLGLKEPDLVDDVIEHILPTYREDDLDISHEKYEADIDRILSAVGTDSDTQRNRLIDELKDAFFVKAFDASNGSVLHKKPSEVYLATERLTNLLKGVFGVFFVDSSQPCLRGDRIRDLLERCGAVRYLRPIRVQNSLTNEERRELREKAGQPRTSNRNDLVIDWTLTGLKGLLEVLPSFNSDRQRKVAILLWQELAHLEERRGKSLFTGQYTWSYYGEFTAPPFPAAFIRELNNTRWVSYLGGELQLPKHVLFNSLGWERHPFLESTIHFKPPIIETLAIEAGFEPEMLDLLSRLGVTSESELRAQLGLEDESPREGADISDEMSDSAGDYADKSRDEDSARLRRGKRDNDPAYRGENGQNDGGDIERDADERNENSEAKPRSFISYVAVQNGQEESDPDSLDRKTRMALEEKAIELILKCEPDWQRTPANNPGYDLHQLDEFGRTKWLCEVKAMAKSLDHRPVGLSRVQFDCASRHGAKYWLYVVENAGTDLARIVRIKDPAGKARTFTFDRGWRDIANLDFVP